MLKREQWRSETEPLELHHASSATSLASRDPILVPVARPEKRPLLIRIFRGGLRGNLRIGAFICASVLLTNILWLIYGVAKYGIKDGYGVISQGPCSSVKKLDIWLHLLINILSTCLQSSTNSFVAAFSSPTRSEVDKMHKKRKWLHVGVFSFRNVRHIAPGKAAVVLCLLATSLPFHLLYNSLVFTSLFTNSYVWSITNESFLHGASFNATGYLLKVSAEDKSPGYVAGTEPPEISDRAFDNHKIGDYYFAMDKKPYFLGENDTQVAEWNSFFSDMQTEAPRSWQNLTRDECIQAYFNIVTSTRRNLLLITKDTTLNNETSLLKWGSAVEEGFRFDSNYWICSLKDQLGSGRACNPRAHLNNETWSVWGHPVDYCLSEVTPAECKLQFALPIMIVVLVFNVIKLGCMLSALFRFDAKNLLATAGDAAISFLLVEDQTTKGMCLAGRSDVGSGEVWTSTGFARPYRSPKRWKEAVSGGRWITFFVIMAVGLGISVLLCAWGLSWLKTNDFGIDVANLWSLGFGTVSQYTMVISPNDLPRSNRNTTIFINMILLANLPQAVLALVYFTYSAILTTMCIAADWSRLAFRAQSLMVSTAATRAQRGLWLLGSPWPFALGLICMQVLMHWLISQSLFIAQIFRMELDGSHSEEPIILNCGYSPLAIIFSIAVGVVMVVVIVILMYKRFPKGSPPVATTNSAAISAACHARGMEYSAPFGFLRWGAWRRGAEENRNDDAVGHCSLMAADVYNSHGQVAKEGELYT